ncbi:MAG: DUF4044 domain-containing protein [Lactobacillales bacterium]|nr:DUF4044 domain-containing protein [Lactobacillales bacterium]
MKWRDRNTFQKITMMVVWLMLIFTIAGIALGTLVYFIK